LTIPSTEQNKTKQNQHKLKKKQNKTKHNKTKRNETKRNETKQSKGKQNKTIGSHPVTLEPDPGADPPEKSSNQTSLCLHLYPLHAQASEATSST
jgi:hypothetical protein